MSNSISDNLQRLQTARSNIATAITNKGGTVGSNDGFEEFVSDISSIPSGYSLVIGTVTGNGTASEIRDYYVYSIPELNIMWGKIYAKVAKNTWSIAKINGIAFPSNPTSSTVDISVGGNYTINFNFNDGWLSYKTADQYSTTYPTIVFCISWVV